MEAIKEYLKLTGMTQVDLAQRAGIQAAELNHYMSGRREPRLKNIRKLADATGISIEKLIKDMA